MDEDTTRTMPRWLQAALIAAVAAAVALPAGAFAAQTLGERFDDVDAADTHAEAIGWLADAGVTAGCTPDEYCPTDGVTRAQMATFMQRLAGGDADVDPVVEAAHALQADQADEADFAAEAGSAEDAEQLGGTDAEDYVDKFGVTTHTVTDWHPADPDAMTPRRFSNTPVRFDYNETGVQFKYGDAQVATQVSGDRQYLHGATVCPQTSDQVELDWVQLRALNQDVDGGLPDDEIEVRVEATDLDGVDDGYDFDQCIFFEVDLEPDESGTVGYELQDQDFLNLAMRVDVDDTDNQHTRVRYAEIYTSSQEWLPPELIIIPIDPIEPILGDEAGVTTSDDGADPGN